MAGNRCSDGLDESKLWSFIRGEVSPEEKRELEAHFSTCSTCSQTLKEIRNIDPVTNPKGAEEHLRRFLAKTRARRTCP